MYPSIQFYTRYLLHYAGASPSCQRMKAGLRHGQVVSQLQGHIERQTKANKK